MQVSKSGYVCLQNPCACKFSGMDNLSYTKKSDLFEILAKAGIVFVAVHSKEQQQGLTVCKEEISALMKNNLSSKATCQV